LKYFINEPDLRIGASSEAALFYLYT
jgi:hypothetical protein